MVEEGIKPSAQRLELDRGWPIGEGRKEEERNERTNEAKMAGGNQLGEVCLCPAAKKKTFPDWESERGSEGRSERRGCHITASFVRPLPLSLSLRPTGLLCVEKERGREREGLGS